MKNKIKHTECEFNDNVNEFILIFVLKVEYYNNLYHSDSNKLYAQHTPGQLAIKGN